MRITRRLEYHGQWLFRHRGLVPLVLLPALAIAFWQTSGFDKSLGDAGEDVWNGVALGVSLAGWLLRCATVGFAPAGTSGRNTRAQRADQLNTTGLYSLVRNPLYLGNFVIMLGVALMSKSWWFLALFALAYALYIERVIAAEESFLAERFGELYYRWAERTPVFFPRLSGWVRPALSFSLRTVLVREYHALLAIAAMFCAIEFGTDLLDGEPFTHWLAADWFWPVFLAFAAAIYAVVRALKKHTHILAVPGR